MLLVISIIFIVLGVLIKYGKMYDLIAGYNTMSKDQQESYNIEGIATVFRNVMFVMALVLIIRYLSAFWLESKRIDAITLILTVVFGISYLLLLANSKKYKNNK